MVLFQWFLMELSVLPGRNLLIRAHLFPNLACASIIASSSSSVHRSFFIFESRWLWYLSLHCLPILPGRCFAIVDQFFAPYLLTSFTRISSSSFVHGPFTSSGLSTFYHRWRHCTSVLSLKNDAIFFQFLAPYCCTSYLSILSSSLVHQRFGIGILMFKNYFKGIARSALYSVFFWKLGLASKLSAQQSFLSFELS